MRRVPLLVLPLALALSAPHAAPAAKKNTCTSKAGKAVLKSNGKVAQTLRSSQYYAYRFPGGTWTFCDSKASPRSAFKSFVLDFNGQKNTGVALFSRPGRCVALQLRPPKNGVPSVPTVDMRKGLGASVHQIDFTAPGAQIVKVDLSSTCLLATAFVSAAGARAIQLNPVVPPNVLQERLALSEAATDADLRALSLSGDTVSWADAGMKRSKHYPGLPPQ